jgi:hypothetical protein
MDKSKSPAAVRLARLMSRLSEEHFFAGWHMGIEAYLWRCVVDNVICEIGKTAIDTLRMLSNDCGGWFIWDEDAGEEVWISKDQWLLIFNGQAENRCAHTEGANRRCGMPREALIHKHGTGRVFAHPDHRRYGMVENGHVFVEPKRGDHG